MSQTASTYTPPSNHARQLVAGGYDLHVHINPDLIQRRISDIELAHEFKRLGLVGFVLKSHYVPTAERAAVVRSQVPGVNVLGSLVLNNPVGGMNAVAVEIAARGGARIVWMPTTDAANEAKEHALRPPGAKLPLWAKLQQDLKDSGIDLPAVQVVDDSGDVLPETRRVLRVIAAHQLVLATGHLSNAEIKAVVLAGKAEGIRQIIVTHPDYPTQNLSIDEQRALLGDGVYLERCFAPAHTGKVDWGRMFEAIRAAGVEHSVLSTDLGQPANPPVEDGLALLADRLLAAGFSDDEIHTMAVTNTVKLAQGENS
jgi:sugar phosphate isomerase/epimerase